MLTEYKFQDYYLVGAIGADGNADDIDCVDCRCSTVQAVLVVLVVLDDRFDDVVELDSVDQLLEYYHLLHSCFDNGKNNTKEIN